MSNSLIWYVVLLGLAAGIASLFGIFKYSLDEYSEKIQILRLGRHGYDNFVSKIEIVLTAVATSVYTWVGIEDIVNFCYDIIQRNGSDEFWAIVFVLPVTVIMLAGIAYLVISFVYKISKWARYGYLAEKKEQINVNKQKFNPLDSINDSY